GLRSPDAAPTTILVATSGDTGAAVAAAFHRRPGFRVVILYPDGKVSPRQAHGLGCWGDNVAAYRVEGSFDDCQRLAKQALSDEALRAKVSLGSANSISLGRLLPQAAYYAHAAARFHAAHGQALNFIVPTGNLGNASAAFVARSMGAPVGEIRPACNANDSLPAHRHRPEAAAGPARRRRRAALGSSGHGASGQVREHRRAAGGARGGAAAGAGRLPGQARAGAGDGCRLRRAAGRTGRLSKP